MQYYSKKLNKLYDTEAECVKAESDYDKSQKEYGAKVAKLNDERGPRAKELEEAAKDVIKAQQHYYDLRDKFLHDYGSYHWTVTTSSPMSSDQFIRNMLKDFLMF
jgi:uncharacterized protein YecT (DUF1311 family)